MATKRLSGSGLAADIRSGMDCVALTEKHDLSVDQLRKALQTIVAKGVLAQSDLPAWAAEEKPWICPKCSRSQSERFPRCPVCGVIIAKLQMNTSDRVSSHLSSSYPATAFTSSDRTEDRSTRHFSGKIVVGAIAAMVAFRYGGAPQPAQPLVHQRDNSANQVAVPNDEPSFQDIAYGSLNNRSVHKELLRSPKVQRIQQLAKNYRNTHTYSIHDQFACVDMSIDLWNQIQTAGIRAGLMAGNVGTDISGIRGENFVQYVAQMNHAWVVAEIEPGRWLPVEATAGGIVSPMAASYSRYFSGEFFSSAGEFKRFEELRRNLFNVCSEAKQMQNNFNESFTINEVRTKEAVLEAYRTRGKLEQRANDCKQLLEGVQQVLNSRSERIVSWTTQ